MGTVNYMSPEQAEGRKLDARSDIFSFGAVLYEMLTGQCAFKGANTIATLTAVLRDDIQPIAQVKPDVPVELEQIVERCLKKDPALRFQSMREVQAALAPLKRLSDSGALDIPTMRGIIPLPPLPSKTSQPRNSMLQAVGAAAALLAIGAGAYWWINRPAPAPPVTQSQPSAASTTTPPLQAADAGPAAPVSPNPPAISVLPHALLHVPAPAPITVPVVLGDALPVRLTLAEDIPTDSTEGDPVRFTVAHDVRVDQTTVIRKGAEASGVIVDGAKKKILGLGGKITFRLESAEAVNGQKVGLRATEAPHPDGVSKRPANNGGRKSKEVAAFAGAEYRGFIDGSNTVMVKK